MIAAIRTVNRKMRERRYIVVVVKVYLMVKHQLGDVNRNPEGDGVWLHGGSSMQPVLDCFTIELNPLHRCSSRRRTRFVRSFLDLYASPANRIAA